MTEQEWPATLIANCCEPGDNAKIEASILSRFPPWPLLVFTTA